MARIPLLLSTSGAVFAGFIGLGIGLVQAGSSLSACLADCKRPQLSATNRASCRLDCENEAASDPEQIRAQMARQNPTVPAAPATPKAAPAEPRGSRAPVTCKAGCEADRSLSVDDRASCKLDCEQEALPVPGGPPPSSDPGLVGVRAPFATPIPTPMQSGFLARCQGTCRAGSGLREAADFETCKLDCETMASVIDVARDWVPDAWLAPAPMPVTPHAVAPAPISTPLPVNAAPRPVTKPPAIAQGCEPALERCNAGCSKHEGTCSRACGRSQRSETDRETCKLTCGTDREVCQGDCLAASATCMNSQAGR